MDSRSAYPSGPSRENRTPRRDAAAKEMESDGRKGVRCPETRASGRSPAPHPGGHVRRACADPAAQTSRGSPSFLTSANEPLISQHISEAPQWAQLSLGECRSALTILRIESDRNALRIERRVVKSFYSAR